MMMKYHFNGSGPNWGVYGVQVLKLNEEIQITLSDLPENLGTPLRQCIEQVATGVVQILMSLDHVDNPTAVHWIAHYAPHVGAPPNTWANETLLWHINAYVRATGP